MNLIGKLGAGITAPAPATTTAIGAGVAAKMGVAPKTAAPAKTLTSDTAPKDTGRGSGRSSAADDEDGRASELERQLQQAGLEMMRGATVKQAALKQPMVSAALLRKYYDEVRRDGQLLVGQGY